MPTDQKDSSMYEVITADQIEPGMIISFLNTQANAVFLLYPTDEGTTKTYRTPALAVNTYGKLNSQETQVVVVEGTFYFPDDAVLVQTGEVSADQVDFLLKQRSHRLAREYS